MARGQRWALILLTLVVAGCGSSAPEPPVPPPDVPGVSASPAPTAPSLLPSPSSSPSSQPQPDGEERVAVPVYYVAETAAGLRLQREFHTLVTSDPASAAVREMLAGPRGIDPDYRNDWPSGAALRAPVRRDGGAIVVDLTGVGSGQMDSEQAELTMQQLVYTVQGALQETDGVRILVDGAPVPQLWGTVDTSAPIERRDPYTVRSLVQIDSPADGAQVGRQVEVHGEAAVFEATVLWEVLRDGGVVQKGTTSTSEGQRFAPFAFTVTLEPGDYTVRIREDDPSGGEGRPALTDDKRITVA